jgi:hypothetical protein
MTMRFRFTIRDLLWLAVVAALAVAWMADRTRIARKYDEFHLLEVGKYSRLYRTYQALHDELRRIRPSGPLVEKISADPPADPED